MGGGDWWYPELGPGTPPMGYGSIYKKKILQDTGPNTHTAATIRYSSHNRSFDAPSPPPKKGYPGAGGVRGSKSKKSLGDHF